MKRNFHSTEHLSPEAVAAWVDRELTESAVVRAAQHLNECEECLAEVEAQRRASQRLGRNTDEVHAPADLVQRLARLSPADFPGDQRDEATGSRVFDRLEAALRVLKPRG